MSISTRFEIETFMLGPIVQWRGKHKQLRWNLMRHVESSRFFIFMQFMMILQKIMTLTLQLQTLKKQKSSIGLTARMAAIDILTIGKVLPYATWLPKDEAFEACVKVQALATQRHRELKQN